MSEKSPSNLWTKKAMAFLIRTEHQLWGKHSEDVLAKLFTLGFTNKFLQEKMFGWNKKLTKRSLESWGIEKTNSDSLVFDKGIVIPYIKNKKLTKLFISGFDGNKIGKTIKLPGSSEVPVFWQTNSKDLLISGDMLLSSYLNQEYGEKFDIINLCEDEIENLKSLEKKIDLYRKIFIFKLNPQKVKAFLSCEQIVFIEDNPFDKNFNLDFV
ncbi:MAG: hypothetical protein RBR53_08560 [Desulforegulaceae bacterium]|nr:hypothetical protein [Desulforegulaceae bacterium]